MKLKPAVLGVLGRDDLKAFVEMWEIDGVDKRNVEAMRAALSRSRRPDAAVLLDSIREDAVKEVCDLVGVDRTGRKSVLVERLPAVGDPPGAAGDGADAEPPAKGAVPVKPMVAAAKAGTRSSGAANGRKVTRCNYGEVVEPRTPETGHTALLPAEDLVVTLPMDNGWSRTIHESHGQTLDRARIDLGRGAFARGQLYVAVSRVRTFAGLRLAKPVSQGDAKCDGLVRDFYDEIEAAAKVG